MNKLKPIDSTPIHSPKHDGLRHYKKSKVSDINGVANQPIHLKLLGFGQQSLIPIENMLEQLNSLPDNHLAGLRTIEYDPSRRNLLPSLINSILHRAPDYCKGVFLQRKRKIIIYEFDSLDMFYHVLFHEIGHFVYFLSISSQLKKNWVTQTHKIEPFVSALSKRNAAEDFAECYATYLTKPDRLKLSPQKYNFIHQSVFGNTKEKQIKVTKLAENNKKRKRKEKKP
jgi:hypothetical protein